VVWAILAIKSLSRAKSRLAPALSDQARRDLAQAMFEDTLEALMQARSLAGIAVVSGDPLVRDMAISHGLHLIHDPEERGHNSSIEMAANALARKRVERIMTVPADVPLITGDDIDRLLAIPQGDGDLLLVPSHDGRGTNALVLSPHAGLKFCFGDDSRRNFKVNANGCRLVVQEIHIPSLALDIDGPEDLLALRAAAVDCRAARWLARHDTGTNHADHPRPARRAA
jgi:2-phospho-L-lactate guanylyltransferase